MTQAFGPAAATPNAFEDRVTLEAIGARTLANVSFQRALHGANSGCGADYVASLAATGVAAPRSLASSALVRAFPEAAWSQGCAPAWGTNGAAGPCVAGPPAGAPLLETNYGS